MLGDLGFDRGKVEYLAFLRSHDPRPAQVGAASGTRRRAVNFAVVRVFHLSQVTALRTGLFPLLPAVFRRSARFCFASARALLGSLDGGADESFDVCPSLASKSAILFLSSETTSRNPAFSARSDAISASSPAIPSFSTTTLFYMRSRGRWWMR